MAKLPLIKYLYIQNIRQILYQMQGKSKQLLRYRTIIL